jgi:hypothetical protein
MIQIFDNFLVLNNFEDSKVIQNKTKQMFLI